MQELTFENKSLPLVEHDGRFWLRSTDIARALGYARTNKIGQIFARHTSEFSASMTTEIRGLSLGYGQPPIEMRLFSLRGAHLLGMFARTSKGVAFRRWVLDQLDAIEAQKTDNRSLIAEWYDAKANLDCQERFASLCGRGLSEHKKQKPPLLQRVTQIAEKIQMALPLVA
jgi:prophage antirepressor-like protein